MKVLHALLLTAVVCFECLLSVSSANTATAKEVVPAISGIVSPAFFKYASGVAVKVCTRLLRVQFCLMSSAKISEQHITVCCPAQISSERLTKVNLGDLETYADGEIPVHLRPGAWSSKTSNLDEQRLMLPSAETPNMS